MSAEWAWNGTRRASLMVGELGVRARIMVVAGVIIQTDKTVFKNCPQTNKQRPAHWAQARGLDLKE